MLGRHVKPGNGRKKEEGSVATPASPPGGYTENQETGGGEAGYDMKGQYGGKGGGYKGKRVHVRQI